MTEAGGPSTQEGIFYQNSVAALYLADLLDLLPRAARERVIDVRVEAPNHVDDLVIHYADRHYEYLNIKSSLPSRGKAWRNLWLTLHEQRVSPVYRDACDKIEIVLGAQTKRSKELSEICQRARSSMNQSEFAGRLTSSQSRLLAAIQNEIGADKDWLELLRQLSVRHLTLEEIKSEFDRRRLGGKFVIPAAMLSTLRDLSGDGARLRGFFVAPTLRQTLQNEFNISISEPDEWGLPAYRRVIERMAAIEIPGTNLNGSAQELFVWPRVRAYDENLRADFEDEANTYDVEDVESSIDLSLFPSIDLRRAIVVAGPGHGKSALLTALSGRLAASPYVPVLIPLAPMGESGESVIEFLSSYISRELQLNADWMRLAEQGLLVLLFDGLDEVPSALRMPLLEKLSAFSARYPNAPWMLTVRDPAAIKGASEAPIIELLPLNDDDVARFVDALRSRLDLEEGWQYCNKLKLYPDIDRLARIPLFLSMLLAIFDLDSAKNTTRSDLIEAYLKTLFSPSAHKAVSNPTDRSLTLRKVSETLAFDCLERQKIGASEKEIRSAISCHASNLVEAQAIFDMLRTNGILKQQSFQRFQFPYPIIQEYLAACHIVAELPDTLFERVEAAIQRPWAQVIQFALEQHPDANTIIEAMLNRTDDAFCTTLRLVGRCVANGACVENRTFGNIRDRLIEYWAQAPTQSRERVGRLIHDGFSEEITPELEAALCQRGLLSNGAGDIVTKAKDNALTLRVFASLLEHDNGTFRYYHDLRPALIAAGDQALQMLADHLNAADLDAGEIDEVSSLLWNFKSGNCNRDLVLSIAENEHFPDQTRMRAYELLGSPLVESAYPLIERALHVDDWNAGFEVLDLLPLVPNSEIYLRDVLLNPEIKKSRKLDIFKSFPQIVPDRERRSDFIEDCLKEPAVDRDIANILRILEARYGNVKLYDDLIEMIPDADMECVGATVSLFGHYKSRNAAERAAELVQKRDLSADDVTAFSGEAMTGMTSIFEMDSFRAGVLLPTLPHPGIRIWRELVEEWSDRKDISDLQRLEIASAGSSLGSELCSQKLESILMTISNFDDEKWDDDEGYGHKISNALHRFRRLKPVLPISIAEKLTQSKKYNIASHGVHAFRSLGTHEALERLIDIHATSDDWSLRDTIEDAIEQLSVKTSVPLTKSGGKFVVQTG